jgi:primase-polymerase (primpol)-like protein
MEELIPHNNWINYNPKTKAPIGSIYKNTTSYEQALKTDPFNVGFVLTTTDPFTCIDLDHCFQGNHLLIWAMLVVDKLNSYTEISPSGEGLHVWIIAKLPGGKGGLRKPPLEIYSAKRFITVTGNTYLDLPINPRQNELEELLNSQTLKK